MKKQLFFTLSALLTLSGCGGGGSAAGGDCQIYCPGVYETPPPSPSTLAQVQEAARNELTRSVQEQPEKAREALSKVPRMVPKRGSVISSTNFAGDHNITRDVFSASIEKSPTTDRLIWNITYNPDPGNVVTVSSSFDISNGSLHYARDGEINHHNLFRTLSVGDDGHLQVLLFSDYSDTSDDYTVAGVYWYIPSLTNLQNTDDMILGAFADGNQYAAVEDITTPAIAIYEGETIGEYTDYYADLFRADVLLTVNFGAEPKISGGLQNVNIRDSGPQRLRGDLTGYIELEEADISTEKDAGGFFTGALRGNIGNRYFTGSWGGQFYSSNSNPLARVAGTFSGGAGIAEGREHEFGSFWGAYWAGQEKFTSIVVGDPDEVIPLAEAGFIDALPDDTTYEIHRLDGIRGPFLDNHQISTNNFDSLGSESETETDRMTLALSGPPGQIQYDLTYTQIQGEGEREVQFNKGEGETASYAYTRDGSNYQRLVISRNLTGNDASAFDPVDGGPGRFSAVAYSNYDEEGDTDYFAGAAWLYVPDAIPGHVDPSTFNALYGLISYGAFMDGRKPFTRDIGDREETATYNGEMMGLYLESTGSRSARPISFSSLSGDVSLTANFAERKISGAFTNINATNKAGTQKTLDDITLGAANISSENGSFRGTLSGGNNWTGYYDGKFYGSDEPSWVAGSAGGGSENHRVNASYFSAIYAAKK